MIEIRELVIKLRLRIQIVIRTEEVRALEMIQAKTKKKDAVLKLWK